MIDLLLDPDKALDAVNKAVALVKKASATVDNVESLGPVLGKYFDAKATAVAAQQQASDMSMGKALEIEMAIEANREFEKQIKDLFFAAGKIDVYQKAEARFRQAQADSAKAAAKAKAIAKKKKQEQDEMIELVLALAIGIALLGVLMWGGWVLLSECMRTGCGR